MSFILAFVAVTSSVLLLLLPPFVAFRALARYAPSPKRILSQEKEALWGVSSACATARLEAQSSVDHAAALRS